MARSYNTGGSTSDIGTQLQDFYFQKKALIELKKEQFFTILASTTGMPKHFGKKIKRYHYMPLLDERNANDQGIDAAGALLVATKWYAFEADGNVLVPDSKVTGNSAGFVSEVALNTQIAANVTAVDISQAEADAMIRSLGTGNLYGSSKDVGTIASKMPMLSETGGRVNRVGFKRIELEGTFEKFGFFDEYTQESMDFDSDSQLMEHINREMLRGAQEMTEDALQIDLLNSAGTLAFSGIATSLAEITGVTADTVSEVTYADLSALSIELDNNRTPKETKIQSGTRLVDTKVIPAARALMIGSEMIPTIERMTDHFGNQAFIPVAHYAAGTSLLNGEIGTVGYFRIVVVPEMMHWAGKGAAEGVNAGYRVTNAKYDVYPMLVVGSESFTTIGFQTSGKMTKFKIFHKKPGIDTVTAVDPFGEMGLMSIKWYYGFMGLRTERLALVYTVARM